MHMFPVLLIERLNWTSCEDFLTLELLTLVLPILLNFTVNICLANFSSKNMHRVELSIEDKIAALTS